MSTPPASVRGVTLLTRQNCSLCEAAASLVATQAGVAGVPWAAIDVDTDPDLRGEYGDRVPVVLVDGVEIGHFRIDRDRLRSALGIAP